MTAILGAFPIKSARICDRWGQSPFIILKYGSPSHKFWRAVSKPWAGRGPLSYALRILIKFLARVLEAQGSLCENPKFCFPDRRLVSCKETGRATRSGKRHQGFGPGSRSSRLLVREPTVLPSRVEETEAKQDDEQCHHGEVPVEDVKEKSSNQCHHHNNRYDLFRSFFLLRLV